MAGFYCDNNHVQNGVGRLPVKEHRVIVRIKTQFYRVT